jgi:hypothetical protein
VTSVLLAPRRPGYRRRVEESAVETVTAREVMEAMEGARVLPAEARLESGSVLVVTGAEPSEVVMDDLATLAQASGVPVIVLAEGTDLRGLSDDDLASAGLYRSDPSTVLVTREWHDRAQSAIRWGADTPLEGELRDAVAAAEAGRDRAAALHRAEVERTGRALSLLMTALGPRGAAGRLDEVTAVLTEPLPEG